MSSINKSQVAKLNISYYDKIAGSYDDILNEESSNKVVRERVREKFTTLVPEKELVLDFGGGTGVDLDWLTANQYTILFCEPSASMREKAIHGGNKAQDRHVIFLENDKTDFSTWHENLPFERQADAILANFGVINCIPDINLLFQNLSLIIKPGGHFIAVFLDRPLRKMWSWHRRNTLKTLLLGLPFMMYVYYKENKQTVFVHSVKEIKRAAASSFDYVSHERISNTGFILIHLVKK